MIEIVLLIAAWLALGVLGAGFIHATDQIDFPAKSRRQGRQALAHSLLFVYFGPIGLFVSLYLTGFAEDGWSLRLYGSENDFK